MEYTDDMYERARKKLTDYFANIMLNGGYRAHRFDLIDLETDVQVLRAFGKDVTTLDDAVSFYKRPKAILI